VGASQLPWDDEFDHSPVFRHLVDLAVRDSSLGIVAPGNSGDRSSAHWDDLRGRWQNHRYVPFYLSWQRIETARESEITLAPGAAAVALGSGR
jgi:acyl-homoserine lactone acylase PvdQ